VYPNLLNQDNPNPSRSKNFNKKFAIFAIIILVAIALPVTVFMVRQQQTIQNQAAQSLAPNTVVAMFNGQKIYKKDIQKVAEEELSPTLVDREALKDALNTLIERKILDKEKETKNIAVSTDEITRVENLEDLLQTDAYYAVLKSKITMLDVRSVKTVSISFWAPQKADQADLTDEEKQVVQNEIIQAPAAFADIELAMQSSQDLLAVASSAATKYPILAPVLAINGSILSSLDDSEKTRALEPQIYEYGDTSLDQITLNGLFSMSVDDIKTFYNTETNQGNIVFKVVEKGNETGATSYEDWLNQEKNLLVTIVYSL
jgi:hypothetical protein